MEDAIAILTEGCGVLPSSLLLHLTLADVREAEKALDKAKEIYDNLLAHIEKQSKLTPSDPQFQTLCGPEDAGKINLVMIHYLRFTARTDGLKGVRTLFSRLRRRNHEITHHLFVAAGLMEYHFGKEKDVASRIFELGMKTASFGENEQYLEQYMGFLHHINDDTSTPLLFANGMDFR